METGLLAKQEVSQFLRENPNDGAGAMKLYEEIKANDVKQHSKTYFGMKYDYGRGRSDTGADHNVWDVDTKLTDEERLNQVWGK